MPFFVFSLSRLPWQTSAPLKSVKYLEFWTIFIKYDILHTKQLTCFHFNTVSILTAETQRTQSLRFNLSSFERKEKKQHAFRLYRMLRKACFISVAITRLDLFFSGLSPEKKLFYFSATSVPQA